MKKRWYIGCSGFHYKEWKDFFYPKGLAQSKWFAYYAEHFNTLELNVTFYRFPQLKFLENWYEKSPEDFVFAAKAPRVVTHYKQFRDSYSLLNDFYITLRKGLKEKLGPVLFQLPPTLAYSDEVLERVLNHMDHSFRNVVEFRHSSWWNNRVYEKLKAHHIVFCGHSYPNLPDNVIINAETGYYRFHGVPELYYAQYEDAFVQSVGDALMHHNEVSTAYVYFNNTATQAALNNAAFLKKVVGQG
jgi:uncharacterized protein YecE (DUF72 family)